MNIQTRTRVEPVGDRDARIVVEVTVDGAKYEVVHMSGPKGTVQDYHEGQISYEQASERIFRR